MAGLVHRVALWAVPSRREGYFYSLDGRSGELLWKANVGGGVASGPISYAVNGRQYISVTAGNSSLVYALRQ